MTRLRIVDSCRAHLLILMMLLAAPTVAPAVGSQSPQASPAVKPSAQTVPAAPAAISDPAGLLALTEAPSAGVGLDEHPGARLPLDLTFRDEDGRPVRLGDLLTRPTVIAPVYFRCPNVCHFLQGELARTLPELKLTAGSDYQVLSISFDETETPELARRTRDTYLAAAGGRVPAQGWRFLTGDREQILKLTGAAGYRFQRVGSDFQHPVAIFVVGSDGLIVRYLQGSRILPKDLALALAEAKAGVVGTTIRKMVQYCFSYDPAQKTYVFNVLRVSATVILATLAGFLAWLVFTGRKKPKDSGP
ncbi:MAG: SCO family protein [Deltaproteobacteria bacterium]|nr:MAG: SCO family protein [Deltaproteobacteria bacterium]